MANGIFGFVLYSVICALSSVICTLYSCFFHSLVSDCVTATPSPARENFRASECRGQVYLYYAERSRKSTKLIKIVQVSAED